MKKFLLTYKRKLCSLLWSILALESLIVIYLLTPSPIDPLVVIEPDFATLSGDNTLSEEDSVARYTVAVSKNLEKELNVSLVYGGSALKGVDYRAPEMVLIKEGEMNATFEITGLDDNELEGEELISVKIAKIDGKNFMEPLRPQDLGGVVFTRLYDEQKHQRQQHEPASVSLSCAKELYENNMTVTCEVRSSQASYEPVVVTLGLGGSAAKGVDYNTVEEVVIPAGKERVSFKVTSIDDAYKEGAETIDVSIAALSGGGFEETTLERKVTTIQLLDEPRSSQPTRLHINNIPKIEEGGSGLYRVSLSREPLSDVTLYVKRNADAAKFEIPEKIVFHPGEREKQFSIVTVDDNVKEKTDFIEFAIDRVEQQSFEQLDYSGATMKTKVTDEPVPSEPDSDTAYLSLSTASAAVDEHMGDVAIVVTASQPLDKETSVILSSKRLDPQGRRYTLDKKVVIKKGMREGTTLLHLQDDNIRQKPEQLEIKFKRHGDGGLEDLRVKEPLILTLSDEETSTLKTTLDLSCDKVLYENGKKANCTLRLSEVTGTPLSVTLDYGGTAEQDVDYKAPKEVTIAKGKRSARLTLQGIDDVIKEGEESILPVISAVEQEYFERLDVKRSNPTVILKDEKRPDKAVKLTLKVMKEVKEGEATPMTLKLSQPALKDVKVYLNMPESDDFKAVKKVVIPQGKQVYSFDVETRNDNLKEQGEYLSVAIAGVAQEGFEKLSFDKRLHRTKIVDDNSEAEAAQLSFSADHTVLYEDDKNIAVTLQLSQPAQKAMRVTLKSAGDAKRGIDYTMPKSVIIKAGQKETKVLLRPRNDNIIEPTEQIRLSVAAAQDGGLERISLGESYRVELLDDRDATHSPAATLSIKGPSKVSEGEATAPYTVTLSQKAEHNMTITLAYSGAATDQDYQAVKRVTIPKGQKRTTFKVQTIDNETIDSLRDFSVRIEKYEGGGLEHVRVADTTVRTSITDEADIAQAFSAIVKDQVIKFDLGSTEVNDEAKETLKKIAALFKEFPSARLTVEGHTNNIGSAESNLRLSQQRANSIKAYLVTLGIEPRRIKAIGYGESRPLLDDGSKEALEFNKRVEFKVVY